ncbi:unnamed protein product, partial [Porites evermanni]
LTSLFYLLDVDECKESLPKCHFDADCTNTEGSYSCLCKSGYFGDGFTCEKGECFNTNKKSLYSSHSIDNVNECLGDNDCHTFADCTNTNGSYTCKCKQGYQGNGKEC